MCLLFDVNLFIAHKKLSVSKGIFFEAGDIFATAERTVIAQSR